MDLKDLQWNQNWIHRFHVCLNFSLAFKHDSEVDSPSHFKMLPFESLWILYKYESLTEESKSGRNFGGRLVFLLVPLRFCPQDRARMAPLVHRRLLTWVLLDSPAGSLSADLPGVTVAWRRSYQGSKQSNSITITLNLFRPPIWYVIRNTGCAWVAVPPALGLCKCSTKPPAREGIVGYKLQIIGEPSK